MAVTVFLVQNYRLWPSSWSRIIVFHFSRPSSSVIIFSPASSSIIVIHNRSLSSIIYHLSSSSISFIIINHQSSFVVIHHHFLSSIIHVHHRTPLSSACIYRSAVVFASFLFHVMLFYCGQSLFTFLHPFYFTFFIILRLSSLQLMHRHCGLSSLSIFLHLHLHAPFRHDQREHLRNLQRVIHRPRLVYIQPLLHRHFRCVS